MCLLYKYNEIWKLCSESSRYTAIFYNDLFLLRTQNLADTSFIVRKSVLRWCYFSICYDRDSELKQGLLNRFIKMFIKLRLIPQRNKSESGPKSILHCEFSRVVLTPRSRFSTFILSVVATLSSCGFDPKSCFDLNIGSIWLHGDNITDGVLELFLRVIRLMEEAVDI